jgi:plasmid stability protein
VPLKWSTGDCPSGSGSGREHNTGIRNPNPLALHSIHVVAFGIHCMRNACVKNIQIRNVPDAVCSELRRKAAEEGLSLQEYLLAHVRELAARPSVREVLGRAAGRGGGNLSAAEAVELIRADRDSL